MIREVRKRKERNDLHCNGGQFRYFKLGFVKHLLIQWLIHFTELHVMNMRAQQLCHGHDIQYWLRVNLKERSLFVYFFWTAMTGWLILANKDCQEVKRLFHLLDLWSSFILTNLAISKLTEFQESIFFVNDQLNDSPMWDGDLKLINSIYLSE